jgi:hypothetical protein
MGLLTPGKKLEAAPGAFSVVDYWKPSYDGRTSYGPLMSLFLGSYLTLVISSLDVAKEFLKTHDLTFSSRPPSICTKYLWYNASGLVV